MKILITDLQPGKNYNLQLRSKSGSRVSAWSKTFNLPVPFDEVSPAVPTGLAVDIVGDSFLARWDEVTKDEDGTDIADFSHYVIRMKSVKTGETHELMTGRETKFELTFNLNVGLFQEPAGVVEFSVAAVDNSWNSSDFCTPVIGANPAPNPVRNLVAKGIMEGITASWEPPEPMEDDFLEYRAFIVLGAEEDIEGLSPTWSGNATSFTYSTLTMIDQYVKVVAVDKFGSMSTVETSGAVQPRSPNVVDTDAPAIPTDVAGTITGDTMTVTWTPPPNTDNDLAGYTVQYRPVGSGTVGWFMQDATHEDSSVDITVKEFVDYQVRVSAYDFSFNRSGYSPIAEVAGEVNIAPAKVLGVEMRAALSTAMVFWTPNSEPDIKGYEVQFEPQTPVDEDEVREVTGTMVSFSEEVNDETPFYARVRAVDNGGLKGEWSDVVTASIGFPAWVGAWVADTGAELEQKLTDAEGNIIEAAARLEDAENALKNADGELVDAGKWVSETGAELQQKLTDAEGNIIDAEARLRGAEDALKDSSGQIVDAGEWIEVTGEQLGTNLAAARDMLDAAFPSGAFDVDEAIDNAVAGAGGSLITYSHINEANKPGDPPTSTVGRKSGDIHRNWNANTGEIYAEWMLGTGGNWNPANFGDEILRSLDVGKITGGSAAFLNFVSDHLTSNQAVINELWTDVVRSRKITTDMLIVGSGENMIPWNPQAGHDPHIGWGPFEISTNNDDDLGWIIRLMDNETSPSNQWQTAMQFRPDTPTRNGRPQSFDVVPGESFRLRAGIGRGGGYPSGVPFKRFYVVWRDQAGANIAPTWVGSNTATGPFDSTPEYLEEITAPAPEGAVTMEVFLQTDNPGAIFVYNASIKRATDSSLVVDGGITAKKITITGDPNNPDETGLVANIASILNLTVDNLYVPGTSTIDTAIIDELWGDFARFKKITTDMLIVGSGENLWPDPLFQDEEAWEGDSTGVANDADAPGGRRYIIQPSTASQAGTYYGPGNSRPITLTPGGHYKIRFSAIRAGSVPHPADGDLALYIRFDRADGTSGVYKAAELPAPTTWIWGTYYEAEFTAPSEMVGGCNVGLYRNGVFENSGTRFADVSIKSMVDSSLVVDGAITAKKITITGDPDNPDETGLVANIASILHLTVDNLYVPGTATIETGIVDELWTQVVRSRKITTDMLVVGSGVNMIVDPGFLDPELTAYRASISNAPWTEIGPSPHGGTSRFRVQNHTGVAALELRDSANAGNAYATIDPGETYRIKYRAVQTSAANATSRPAIRYRRADGTSAYVAAGNYTAVENDLTKIATAWLEFTWTAPADAVEAALVIQAQGIESGACDIVSPSMTVSGASLIVDGSIKARAIDIGELVADAAFITKVKSDIIETAFIKADQLIGGQGIIDDLLIKANLIVSTGGVVKSTNYSSTNGWRLTNNSLVINQGSISARALKLQVGQNIMPAAYANFEFPPSFYDLATVGNVQTSIVTYQPKYGDQCLYIKNTGTTATRVRFTNSSELTRNISVQEGETYIMSLWAKGHVAPSSFRFLPEFDGAANPSLPYMDVPANSTWTRYSQTVTIPAGATTMFLSVFINAGTVNRAFWVDGIQVEPQTGSDTTPSVWTPGSAFTVIDGGMIRTGEIRSNVMVSDGVSSNQPAWSLNANGGMQVGSAVIRGSLVVGTSSTANTSFMQSGVWTASSGWRINADGSAEFRKITVGANQIDPNSITAGNITSPLIVSSSISSSTGFPRAVMNSNGFYHYGSSGTVQFSATSSGVMVAGDLRTGTASKGIRIRPDSSRLADGIIEFNEPAVNRKPFIALESGYIDDKAASILRTSGPTHTTIAAPRLDLGHSTATGGGTYFFGTAQKIQLYSSNIFEANTSNLFLIAGNQQMIQSGGLTVIDAGGALSMSAVGALTMTTNQHFRVDVGNWYLQYQSDGLFYVPGLHGNTTTAAANVNSASQGLLRRTTSLSSAKVAITPLGDEWKAVKSLQPVTYYDRVEAEKLAQAIETGDNELLGRVEHQTRHLGLTAEQVESTGTPGLAMYDGDGKINGVAYERVGVALIPWLHELEERLERLEGKEDR